MQARVGRAGDGGCAAHGRHRAAHSCVHACARACVLVRARAHAHEGLCCGRGPVKGVMRGAARTHERRHAVRPGQVPSRAQGGGSGVSVPAVVSRVVADVHRRNVCWHGSCHGSIITERRGGPRHNAAPQCAAQCVRRVAQSARASAADIIARAVLRGGMPHRCAMAARCVVARGLGGVFSGMPCVVSLGSEKSCRTARWGIAAMAQCVATIVCARMMSCSAGRTCRADAPVGLATEAGSLRIAAARPPISRGRSPP